MPREFTLVQQPCNSLLPKGWRGEFRMLTLIRNQLTHASEQEFNRIEHPEIVLNTYARAIEALNDSSNDQNP